MAEIQLMSPSEVAVDAEPVAEPVADAITETVVVPVQRGRGRPPGAKNKPKVAIEAPVVEAPVVEAPPLTKTHKRKVADIRYPEVLAPELPMTPLELSRQLRLIAEGQRDQKREYYSKMLAHLL